MVVAAKIVALWIYFRLATLTSGSTFTLDPPDVIYPLPPSYTTLGVFRQLATVAAGGPCAVIGRQMLCQGGSAVDATIAILLCDGACVMQAMGIGGGFLMTIYNRTEGKMYALVARETAPALANQTMYTANPSLTTFGPLAAGIPGELKGYQEAHKRFGKLPWRVLFQPTIKLCEEGVPVSKKMALYFYLVKDKIENSPTMRNIILQSTGGRLPNEGELLRLPLLARTLRIIADSPLQADELYNGSLTAQFVADIQACGGIITEEDMRNYRVRWEEPVAANLSGGLTVYSAPLPGSGVLVNFMMRLMDGPYQFTISDLQRSQLLIETFKHAYGRRTNLGDPHFVDPDLLRSALFNLTNEETIIQLRSKIFYNMTSQDVHYYGANPRVDDHGTNNVVVLAPDGSAVCVTSTINSWFGSTFVSSSTGILLNDQMDDFIIPGEAEYWPTAPNIIEPGKRPLSSMSPTIVIDQEGDVRLVVVAAGGTTITTQITAVMARNLWQGMNIKEAIDRYRFHHELLPMEVSYEYGVPVDILEGLRQIGHRTRRRTVDEYPCGIVTAIARLRGLITANWDFRGPRGNVCGL